MELWPAILRGSVAADPATELLGRRYPLPCGIAPVGMAGVVWPDAERILARVAAGLGEAGVRHVFHILDQSIRADLGQMA